MNLLMVAPEAYKIFIQEAFPNKWALYAAALRAGYTVNGIRP
jgi:hypothetical protein